LQKLIEERDKPTVHPEPFALERDNGVRMELALTWTESTDEAIRSFANGIPTAAGGTHESGLRQGLGKAVRSYMEQHKLSPKGVKITAEDIREGLLALLSVYVVEPQFQGQTKDKLNNPEVTAQVENIV